ncbi:hypothetical protein HDU97_007060 [Phlyctochytrium planicorne]|nr:hypothetical protein HDU97_007060 [Phlyctochytrium planicorne]
MSFAPPPGPPPPDAGSAPAFRPPPGPPPEGMLSIAQLAQQARSRCLGHFAKLTDPVLHGVLGTLDARSLNALSQVNKAFYIFARDDSVWRSLCIRAYAVSKALSGDERQKRIASIGLGEDALISFKGSWRLTYYFPKKHLSEKERAALSHAKSILASPITPPFFSDFIYQKTVRNNMDLKGFVPDFSTGLFLQAPIVKDSGKNPNAPAEFRKRFDSTSTPVLIKNGFEFDTAKWDVAALKAKFGGHRFSIGTEQPAYLYGGISSEPLLFDMTFEDYLDYIKLQRDESPLYIFDGSYGEKIPELTSYYKIPRFFEEDFLSVLGDRRPPFRWVVAGPSRSGATWHVDPFYTSAWNALVKGRKRWCLYPPTFPPPGLLFDKQGRGFKAPIALHWFLEVYPQIPLEFKPIEVIQEPGDVIFVPAGWWHAVLNLDEVNIAVTQNFVGEANLEKVLAEIAIAGEKKKFNELRTLLTAQKPELVPSFMHIHSLYGDTEDPLILAEGCKNKADFFDYFTNLDVWLPRIAQVWKTEFEGETAPNSTQIFPIRGGSNPVFLHPESNRILKFYAHMDGGQTTHAVESYVLQSVTQSKESEIALAMPKFIASGRLLGGKECKGLDARGVNVADGKWSWPYIFMSRVGGDKHIPIGGWEWKVRATAADEEEGAEKEYRKRERAKAGDAGPSGDLDPHWASTVKWIALKLKSLHAVRPTTTNIPGANAKDRRVYKSFVKNRVDTCLERHKDLGSLPKHLLDEVAQRLPEFLKLALSEHEKLGPDFAFSAGILHGDMNPGNVLGEIVGGDGAQQQQVSKEAAVFNPDYLIDFGDSFSVNPEDNELLDALWDLGGTYVGILKCDPRLLHDFMDAYTGGKWSLIDKATKRKLCERMLVLTLVCGHQGYIRYVVRAAGGTKRLAMESIGWDRLVDELFPLA